MRGRRPKSPVNGNFTVPRLPAWARRITAVVLAGLAATVGPATGAYAATSGPDLEAVDRLITQGLQKAAIPGAAIAITRGSEVVHVRGYGVDSRNTPVTEHTPFRIASTSKAFTSLAVMQLVDAGKLALDDPVAAHLPEFRLADPRGAGITIRQLLDQTSGLADGDTTSLPASHAANLNEAVAALGHARLVADPGTRFNYHNPNYQIAARLVEVVSGEPFDQYLQTHLFGPAGMKASTTTNRDTDPAANLVDGHVMAYGIPVAAAAPGEFTAGSGGVVSTAADLAQWQIVQANGGIAATGNRLVSTQSMAEMHTSQGPSGYALGWSVNHAKDRPDRLEHNGNLLTYSSETAIYPASRIGITLLFNSSSGLMLEQNALFHAVLKIIENGSSPVPSQSLVTAANLDGAAALLTLAAILLAIRGLRTSRPWAQRSRNLPVLGIAGTLPYLTVLAIAFQIPYEVGWLLQGRVFTWETIAYGWPALAVLAAVTALTSVLILVMRLWHLIMATAEELALPAPVAGK